MRQLAALRSTVAFFCTTDVAPFAAAAAWFRFQRQD
jgi:hypothetical protein